MPEWKNEIIQQLAGLNLPPAREAEIVEEVAQHLEDRYRELLAGGMAEHEARRVALQELSREDLLARGLHRVEQEVKEEPTVLGGSGGDNPFGSIWRDLRFGARQMWRNPGFAAVAVLSLALGIGANALVFSVVNALVLKPLPVERPDQLAFLETQALWSRPILPKLQRPSRPQPDVCGACRIPGFSHGIGVGDRRESHLGLSRYRQLF